MSVELPERAWVVLASTKPDGGGELVSWHDSAAEAEAILHEWGPQLAVVDMDHADSTTSTGHRVFERGTVTDEKRPPWPPAVGWR